MPTPNEISSRIVNALYLSDPEIDASIGTPLRKIIDATAEQMSTLSVDNHLVTYQYDVDSKSGGDLDDFVANYGLDRLLGQRATGTVTFSRSTATAAITIPAGTQVTARTLPPQSAITTIQGNLSVGQTSVDIPVQAVDPGPAGNVLAGALNTLASTVNGISGVNNSLPLTGGTLTETDMQLRTRFKQTVFRNLAGTEQMYRAIALQTLTNPNVAGSTAVTRTSILGSTSHQTEQLAFSGGGAQNSTLTSSAYNYSDSTTVTDSTGNVLIPTLHYNVSVNNGVSPATLTITPVNSTLMPNGLYTIDYDYIPTSSRNDPLNARFSAGSANNRVDIYVNGISVKPVTQVAVYNTAVQFNNTSSSPLYAGKYKTSAGTSPASGDKFTPLTWVPIVSIPTSMTVDGDTYTYPTHYELVHRDDAFGYSPNSLAGIWWKPGIPSPPANNFAWSISYNYNEVPRLVAQNIANWRLLGTDVQVHAGKIAYFNLNLAVVYFPTFNVTDVQNAITSAITDYFNTRGFKAGIEISDLLQVAHNVNGVDNVRFLTIAEDSDPSDYGLVQVAVQPNNSGTPTVTVVNNYSTGSPYYRPTDVYFDERTYPQLYKITFTTKARNTF